jgi:hypothetical protein
MHRLMSLGRQTIAVQLQSEVARHVCLDYVLLINRYRQTFHYPYYEYIGSLKESYRCKVSSKE